jgi:hypothetical protein
MAGVEDVKAISDDIGLFDEPFFQSSPIDEAIEYAKTLGITYFSSGERDEQQSYDSPYRSSEVTDE